MNYEAPLTSLVWLTSIISIGATYAVSYLMIPDLGGDTLHVVEAVDHHHLRHAGRRDHSRTGEGLHLGGIAPRAGSGDLVARRRRVAEYSFRPGGRQLQRVLAGPGDDGPDGHRLRRSARMASAGTDDGPAGVRLRPGRVRIPGHGTGDHRGRFLRPGDGQRAVGLRADPDRTGSRTSRRSSRRTSASTPISKRPSITWKRTTAPATRSRRPRSRC